MATHRHGFFYGWIILLLCFLAMLAGQGVRASAGVFILPWEQEFAAGRSVIGLVPTLILFVFGVSQPVAGRLVDRFGSRPVMIAGLGLVAAGLLLAALAQEVWQLCLAFGVLMGMGVAGTSNVVAAGAVAQWFYTRRGLAFGLTITGMSAGQALLVPLAIALRDALGWRPALVGLGVFTLALVPVALLFMRSDPTEMGLRPYGADLDEGAGGPSGAAAAAAAAVPAPAAHSVWRERAFWHLSIPYFLCGFTTAGLMATHLVPFAHGIGIATAVISAAVVVGAVATAVGALASGPLSDRYSRGGVLGALYSIRLVSFALALFWVASPLSLIVFVVLFSISDFATIAPTAAAGADLFGPRRVGLGLGLLALAHQLGSATGALVPGVLFDLTGSYDLSFVAAVAAMAVAAALSYRLPSRIEGRG